MRIQGDSKLMYNKKEVVGEQFGAENKNKVSTH
jgi:hypothetical protein